MPLTITEALATDARRPAASGRASPPRADFAQVLDAARSRAPEPETPPTAAEAPSPPPLPRADAQEPARPTPVDSPPKAETAARKEEPTRDGAAASAPADRQAPADKPTATDKPTGSDRSARQEKQQPPVHPEAEAAEGSKRLAQGGGPAAAARTAAAPKPQGADAAATARSQPSGAAGTAVKPAAAETAPKSASAGAAARPRDAERAAGTHPEAADAREKAAADSRSRRQAGERVLTSAEQLVAAAAVRAHPMPQPLATARSDKETDKKPVEGPRREGTSEPRVVVIDLRRAIQPPSREKPIEPAEPAGKTGREAEREGRGLAITLVKAERAGEPAPGAPAAQGTARFREALQTELVRQSTMVLRDGGAASEMQLVLKPESLGSVRIHLKMVDNRLEGQIVVDNGSVRQLFESVLPALESGLRDQGFGSASLQVSVGHRDASTGQRDSRHALPRVEAVGAIASQVRPAEGLRALRLGDGVIDLIV